MIIVQKSSLSSDIQFSIKNDLFYFTNYANRKRLCLLKEFEKKIFAQTHDENSHTDFSRTYKVITTNFYFRKLSNRLHRYISHCHECNLNQIKRHALYDSLNFIIDSSISFHIVNFDFILTLSNCQDMNTIMSIICKFFKKVTILSNKNIFSVEN